MMRSMEESIRRWQNTVDHSSSLDQLRKSVNSKGNESPCDSGLRSVCWKTFLLFQTTDTSQWTRMLTESRSAYTSLREHLLRYIDYPDELGTALDPLDDDLHSPWNTLRQDEEARAEIFQDVERCMPDEPFFRRSDTQLIMLNILFIFCKINQDVGYRQGMHELLAPILWVVEKDALVQEPSLRSSTDSNKVLKQIIDPAFIEHDAFTLLSLVMRSAKSFYELGDPGGLTGTNPFTRVNSQQGNSPIVERSQRIHEVYLAHLDPALALHLTDIEVLPQIFLIRWIRLLFGREFPFEQLLELWDVIFGEDPDLELIDMVCVSMLLRIRWQLIDANYSSALMLLLKYPIPTSPSGAQTFVADAIYLRDNYSAIGGASIITKYSGKSPAIHQPDSRPDTPLDHPFIPKQKLSRTMSPIPSPARFLQQQGGVEALIRDAAKGVFEHSERLGINQVVRDTAREVKKNMQGFPTPRANTPRRVTNLFNRSFDEGQLVPSPDPLLLAMSDRNQKLAKILEDAVSILRSASISREAIEIVCSKLEHVKVSLEDTSLPLPLHQEQNETGNGASSVPNKTLVPLPHSPIVQHAMPVSQPSEVTLPPEKIEVTSMPSISPGHDVLQGNTTPSYESQLVRPSAPVPTRSTIANSSFSWMLEPGEPTISSPSKSSSPFHRPSKKLISGTSREKTSFLFGDDPGTAKANSGISPPLSGIVEGFDLVAMKNPTKENAHHKNIL